MNSTNTIKAFQLELRDIIFKRMTFEKQNILDKIQLDKMKDLIWNLKNSIDNYSQELKTNKKRCIDLDLEDFQNEIDKQKEILDMMKPSNTAMKEMMDELKDLKEQRRLDCVRFSSEILALKVRNKTLESENERLRQRYMQKEKDVYDKMVNEKRLLVTSESEVDEKMRYLESVRDSLNHLNDIVK